MLAMSPTPGQRREARPRLSDSFLRLNAAHCWFRRLHDTHTNCLTAIFLKFSSPFFEAGEEFEVKCTKICTREVSAGERGPHGSFRCGKLHQVGPRHFGEQEKLAAFNGFQRAGGERKPVPWYLQNGISRLNTNIYVTRRMCADDLQAGFLGEAHRSSTRIQGAHFRPRLSIATISYKLIGGYVRKKIPPGFHVILGPDRSVLHIFVHVGAFPSFEFQVAQCAYDLKGNISEYPRSGARLKSPAL
ncbi:hypothetical protein C8R47DRAFT_1241129 [Mycena vitilis]|nr:hypothetical protein C8R47DRAFT_1241129 [Mycena vitilis]